MHYTYCCPYLLYEDASSSDHGRELRVWTPVKVLLCLVRLVQWESTRWMSSPPILQNLPSSRWQRIRMSTSLSSKRAGSVHVWWRYLMKRKPALLRRRLRGLDLEVDSGIEGLCRAATYDGVEMVMSAVVGSIGLLPTIRAVDAGIHVALANKETLVMAGELVHASGASRRGAVSSRSIANTMRSFRPCMGMNAPRLRRILLTASGGPFRDWSREAMHHVSDWRMRCNIRIGKWDGKLPLTRRR